MGLIQLDQNLDDGIIEPAPLALTCRGRIFLANFYSNAVGSQDARAKSRMVGNATSEGNRLDGKSNGNRIARRSFRQ